MKRCVAVAVLLLLMMAGGVAGAVESGLSGVVADVFDAGRARMPKPGEWLEYRVAFLADPLEHGLRPDRGETVLSGRRPMRVTGGENEEFVFFVPHFESDRVWRVAPLRLEVREVTDGGCNVVTTFAGESHEFFLARGDGAGEAAFDYDADASSDGVVTVRLGERDYEVEETRRVSERYGLVRRFSEEVPFGVVRFATPDVDLALVGMGMGRAPDFPLEAPAEIVPALGLLYYGAPDEPEL